MRIVEGEDKLAVVPEQLTQLVDPVSSDQAIWRRLQITAGDRLPELNFQTLEGQDAFLKLGVPYFLNLWATWCLPCREEMPELEHLYTDFKKKGIELVGINVDLDAEPTFVEQYAAELGVSYPLYLMNEDSVSKIFDQAMFIPLSMFVDEEGRVVDVFEGWSIQSQNRICLLYTSPSPRD